MRFSSVIFIANDFGECLLELAIPHVHLDSCANFQVLTHTCQVLTCVACVLFMMPAAGLYGLFIDAPSCVVLQKDISMNVMD